MHSRYLEVERIYRRRCQVLSYQIDSSYSGISAAYRAAASYISIIYEIN